ncbi:hypothetical protein PCE1_000762 [Barthelona sp. PCE]
MPRQQGNIYNIGQSFTLVFGQQNQISVTKTRNEISTVYSDLISNVSGTSELKKFEKPAYTIKIYPCVDFSTNLFYCVVNRTSEVLSVAFFKNIGENNIVFLLQRDYKPPRPNFFYEYIFFDFNRVLLPNVTYEGNVLLKINDDDSNEVIATLSKKVLYCLSEKIYVSCNLNAENRYAEFYSIMNNEFLFEAEYNTVFRNCTATQCSLIGLNTEYMIVYVDCNGEIETLNLSEQFPILRLYDKMTCFTEVWKISYNEIVFEVDNDVSCILVRVLNGVISETNLIVPSPRTMVKRSFSLDFDYLPFLAPFYSIVSDVHQGCNLIKHSILLPFDDIIFQSYDMAIDMSFCDRNAMYFNFVFCVFIIDVSRNILFYFNDRKRFSMLKMKQDGFSLEIGTKTFVTSTKELVTSGRHMLSVSGPLSLNILSLREEGFFYHIKNKIEISFYSFETKNVTDVILFEKGYREFEVISDMKNELLLKDRYGKEFFLITINNEGDCELKTFDYAINQFNHSINAHVLNQYYNFENDSTPFIIFLNSCHFVLTDGIYQLCDDVVVKKHSFTQSINSKNIHHDPINECLYVYYIDMKNRFFNRAMYFYDESYDKEEEIVRLVDFFFTCDFHQFSYIADNEFDAIRSVSLPYQRVRAK